MKIILTGKDARASVRKGINLVSDCVKVTLGSNGRNAILGRMSQTPLTTNDGVTIADYVEVENESEQLGVMLAKEVSRLAEKESGDGTTTATILFQALVNKCIDIIDNDEALIKSKRVSPLAIRNEINVACDSIVKELEKNAKKISTKEDILKVAKVSVEDGKLAHLLADIFYKIGKDGLVLVEENGTETTHEIVQGIDIPSGVSEIIVGDEMSIDEPKILVTTDKITEVSSIVPILEKLSLKGVRNLVVFARDFDDTVIKTIEKNHVADVFTVLPIKSTDPSKKYQQEDIASLSGTKLYSVKDFGGVAIEDLGKCGKIVVTPHKTMFLGGESSAEYIAKLKKEQKEAESEFDKDNIGKRISALSGGVALIKIGASSQSEREYLKLKLDDAVLAVKYAMQNGVVKGGGLALKEISEKLPTNILTDVVVAPYNQIIENGGGDICDDIIDPVKVTISALKSACSVGGIVITSEVAIAEKYEKSKIEEEN